jgi:DNA-binding MarR family transcriptional regulator
MLEDETAEQPRTESENTRRDIAHTPVRAVLPLTERQLRVLVAIEQFIAARGYPPTVRALCEMLRLTSTNGVSEHLRALVRKGYLERDPAVPRGMRVVVASTKSGVAIAPRPLAKTRPCMKCGTRVA